MSSFTSTLALSVSDADIATSVVVVKGKVLELSGTTPIPDSTVATLLFSTFKEQIISYIQNSQIIQDLDEYNRVYRNLRNIYTDNNRDMQELINFITNKNNKTSQQYRLSDFKVKTNKFYTQFVKYTFMLTALVFILGALYLGGQFSGTAFLQIAGTMIIIYMFFFAMYSLDNLNRVPTDFDKFMWGTRGIKI